MIRAAEPRVRLGWSVPKLRRDPFESKALAVPALAAMLGAAGGPPVRRRARSAPGSATR